MLYDNLTQPLSKKEFKREYEASKKRLTEIQLRLIELKIPVIIVFDGFSASGKGTQISRLLYPLDPRHFDVFTMSKVTEDMQMRPFLWSFWTKTPQRGRIAIFDKSWHRLALPESQKKWKLTPRELTGFDEDTLNFEKSLRDDGFVILKFFLDISAKEQRARFDQLLSNPDTAWRVDSEDINQNKHFDKIKKQYYKMIKETSTDCCPWHLIEADDGNFATLKIFRILIDTLEQAIYETEHPKTEDSLKIVETFEALSLIEADKLVDESEYKEKLDYLQKQLAQLSFKLYKRRRSVVLVYEGKDAAGKGGNIKRLTQELDPRGYEVISIAAPTSVELSHNYLWRFWNRMPKDGHLAIFDRSWYGRVLVERVEGFCSESEWRRAYQEINDMEQHLASNGTIICKFWLHIDDEEQLRRFNARMEDPLKRHKITDEDWRNREKWNEYELAVNEMLVRTNTPYAPWVIVESNNKKFARLKTLEYMVKTLEEALK